MRHLYFITLLLLASPLVAQWQGDIDKYEIFTDSLHLNGNSDSGGISYLSMESDLIENATWEFRVDLEFNPSGSNYAQVYLVSDSEDFSGNAYYVKVGGSTDEVSVYRQDGELDVEIIDGLDDRVDLSLVSVNVKVVRSDGNWTLFTSVANLPYEKEGEVNDLTYFSTSYFGVQATYTKTRASHFSFSHFSITGSPFVDNVAPHLDSIVVTTRYQCLLYFDEWVEANAISCNGEAAESTVAQSNNLTLNFKSPFFENDSNMLEISVSDTSGNVFKAIESIYYDAFEVVSTSMQGANVLQFELSKSTDEIALQSVSLAGQNPMDIIFQDGVWLATFETAMAPRTSLDLVISNVVNRYGDILQSYSESIVYYTAEFGDIVFSELMPDPSPVVGDLPEAEYIELFNRMDFVVDLKDFELIKGDQSYVLPSYKLEAHKSVVMTTKNDEFEFPENVNSIGLNTFPTLNNTTMTLQLVSSDSIMLDAVSYDSDWHDDAFKGAGGFSLERIDVDNLSQDDNWLSTCSLNGGTPGFENCVIGENPDYQAPFITDIYALDTSRIYVEFSELVTSNSMLQLGNYLIEDQVVVDSILMTTNLLFSNSLEIKLSESMNNNVVYEIAISGIQDVSGNEMDPSIHSFAICDLPKANDILISEIMYAPLSGEAEYIEIYNNTDFPFDLSHFKITEQDDDDTWKAGSFASEKPRIFLPRTYMALSSDISLLSNQYTLNQSSLGGNTSVPTLNNESGGIALILPNATVIDYLYYSDDWQSSLLNDTRGVALERLSFNRPTNASDNWFSASSIVNYGTPGFANSQQAPALITLLGIELSPKVFTPDGDGLNDFTTISINEMYDGGTMRLQIFNHRGIAVRELSNNMLLGSYNSVVWDGADANGARCPMGIYIIWLEIVTAQGEVITEKLECVISIRM